jgi:hypothetical protein
LFCALPDPDRLDPWYRPRRPLIAAIWPIVALLTVSALGARAVSNADPRARADSPPRSDSSAPRTTRTAPKTSHQCLAAGGGYLRVRIRGALQLDVDLHNAELECDGGARPDGSGIRVSFAGPLRSDGRRLRMVFGISGAAEGASVRERPTNLTVIFEGEERIFATRGDDKCTTDELQQERTGALAGPTRSYRVTARGFCIAPVSALSSNTESILVTRFDFAGSVTYEDPNH